MKKILFLIVLLSIQNVFAQLNITFRSNLNYPVVLSNIWGYADGLGNEYALVGTNSGLSIVNVTNPDLPVEVQTVSGPPSNWREIKTKGNYAFVTTEGGSSGLQIVNLSGLPGSVTSQYWAPTIGGDLLETIHALHVDGNYLYLYGTNIDDGGPLMVDVTDPWNPVYINNYLYPGTGTIRYVHDGVVVNDTLYGGHIYSGFFDVVDVTDKMNPQILATQTTPGAFTHNTWLSDDHKTVFTTDEVQNSFLASYDLTDLANIKELDRVQSNPGSNSVVHNTLVRNDYCVTSWYKDGVVIVDGNKPDNLVIVGNYDTYAGAGNGFNGAWGVYPFLPSGNIVVSDIDNGLFVLTPTYVRAGYLEGIVTDSICGTVLSGALIEILSTSAKDYSNLEGVYKTGLPGNGTYSVKISKPGYTTKIIPGVNLTSTFVTTLNVQLFSATAVNVGGQVLQGTTSTGLEGARIVFSNATNTYQFNTDASGNYSSCSIQAGTYEVYCGKWGYQTLCLGSQSVNAGSANVISFNLERGYYDDFIMDFGWTVSGPSLNAWERAQPQSTNDMGAIANPGTDAGSDCGLIAFVTDNGGGSQWDADVDNGQTILTSPVFDVSGYLSPVLNYHRWFYNANSLNGTPNDTMTISLSDGTTEHLVEMILPGSMGNGTWLGKSFSIDSFTSALNNLRLIVRIGDEAPGNVVEGGFDRFNVTSSGWVSSDKMKVNGIFVARPNPFSERIFLDYQFLQKGQAKISLFDIAGREVFSESIQDLKGTVEIIPDFPSGWYFGVFFLDGKMISTIPIIRVN